VLVIGGGATGTGIARDLSLRGVEVMLAERDGLASGSRSRGLLHSGARYAEANRVGAKERIVENRIRRAIAGGCVRETGGLFVQLAGDG
jgi:glycerol-3-phosphate dehydrogenase